MVSNMTHFEIKNSGKEGMQVNIVIDDDWRNCNTVNILPYQIISLLDWGIVWFYV
jgi:hypothetical protein